MIDKATQERIKDAADIVDIVSDYVHLQKRGRNYMGLCPFHNERTPSFSVNRERNFCYCFSCHKGGSPVNFIMEKEGLSYHDALLHLAKKYGITVEERELTDEERARQSEIDSMYASNEWALQQMESYLHDTDEGRDIALQYLYNRGITAAAIKKYRLGYSPDTPGVLAEAAHKAGFDIEILIKTGVIGRSESDGRLYDKYRARIIFPITNPAGKVIGFGGRGIKGEKAKYINSPASVIYNKSGELYGLYQAKNEITRRGKCILVEGYLDVIGLWQAGIQNAVASSGTALTDGQIALIHRFCNAVTLIYDGDQAGIHAAIRGADMLLSHKLDVGVVVLPDGHDPHSFSLERSAEELSRYLEENETDVVTFKTRIAMKDASDDPRRRTEAIASVVETISCISDEAKRYVYIQECSKLLRMPEELILKQVAAKVREKRVAGRQRRNRDAVERNIAASQTNVNPTQGAPASRTPLEPFEREVIKLCVRYAMVDFCPCVYPDGSSSMLSVVDFVEEELKNDGITFTEPVYAQIFSLLLDMRHAYNEEVATHNASIEDEIAEKRKEGIENIRQSAADLIEIEKAEEKLNEELEALRRQRSENFAQLFAAKHLASHENDAIRQMSVTLLTPRHQLSRIHDRRGHVEKEFDKLPELLPRAVTELKNGIIDLQMHQISEQIAEASAHDDYELVGRLQRQLQNYLNIRKQISSDIGDRVVAPRRK